VRTIIGLAGPISRKETPMLAALHARVPFVMLGAAFLLVLVAAG
jgi:hypothetical protein